MQSVQVYAIQMCGTEFRFTPIETMQVFVTTHAAFNLELEKSLRSIDETLSAHYWEFSEDSMRWVMERIQSLELFDIKCIDEHLDFQAFLCQ